MGLSTEGYSLTPRYIYPTAPKMRMSSVITVANTGRRMESSEMFMSVKTEIGKRKSENLFFDRLFLTFYGFILDVIVAVC